MVLSEEAQTDLYPVASMETGTSETEKKYYNNIEETRTTVPVGYPTDSYTDPNAFVSKLNGSFNKIGTGVLLRVMSGDKINIRASSWYRLNGTDPGTPVNPLSQLLLALTGGLAGGQNGYSKAFIPEVQAPGILTPGITDFLNQQTSEYSNTTRPKAYLNWILFDEQFKYVSTNSGFDQVGADQEFKIWVRNNLPVTRNGYLYVYTSNESPVDVFFDNLQVTHVRGPLLEETHYYPFGLTMAGISSKAAGKLENKYKYNKGSELQHQEFSDGSGLEMYDTHFRNLDPQIGRWWQVDPKPNESESPYASMGNNPILKNDPLGDTTIPGAGFWRNAWEGLKDGGKSTAAFVKSLGTKEGWQNLANGISALEGMDPQSVSARTEMGMQVVNGVKNIPNMTKDDWGHAVGFGAEKVVEGALLSKGAGMIKNAVAGAGAETQVYRVFGGDAAAEGHSWTPVNPNSISNFRDAAGLPSGGASGSTNTGRFVIEGTVKNKNILNTRSALPLDGNKGGLPEFIIKPKNVTITRVSGVNPNF